MKLEPGTMLLLGGFAVILAFIVFLLIPQVSGVRAGQMDLLLLEARVRLALVEDLPYEESGVHLFILVREEFFASLAYIRTAAINHGLNVTEFSATEFGGFGISETTVRANLTGSFADVISYVYYLAGGVYNIRYFTLVNAEMASFDVWITIFHEG